MEKSDFSDDGAVSVIDREENDEQSSDAGQEHNDIFEKGASQSQNEENMRGNEEQCSDFRQPVSTSDGRVRKRIRLVSSSKDNNTRVVGD